MNKDAVQHERGPRNSTLRRHMALYKDAIVSEIPTLSHELMFNSALTGLTLPPLNMPPVVLDLSLPRVGHHSSSTFFGHHNNYLNAMTSRILPPTPPLLAVEQIKETAAEHLFKNVNWIKSVRAFTELPMSDQLLLLEESWKEFFILAISQYLMPIHFGQLLYAYETENTNREHLIIVAREVQLFHDLLNQMAHLNIDTNEYDYLRAIILFKKNTEEPINTSVCIGESPCSSTSESRTLQEYGKINSLYDEAKTTLITYIGRTHLNQPLRFQSLMHIISLMNSVSSFTIEELFFRKTIGEITIVRLISDMYIQKKI